MGQVEIALLRVLANQTSAVLENMRLMEEVVKARNEARKLLRQVLDDQRMNALILESVPSGLITIDQTDCIHTFNRAAEVILGYHHYEVLGQPLRKYLNLDLLSITAFEASSSSAVSPAQKAFLAAMHTGESQHQTVITVDRYDREVVLALDIRPLYNDSGKQVGMLIAFTDMTSMHRLEEEKRRLDRLASLGEMATNVAHEVRNPLASIKISIQMLRDDLFQHEATPTHDAEGDDESQANGEVAGMHFDWAAESIAVVLKEVERLDTIVHELLLFAKPRQLHRVPCTIQELSDHVLAVIERQYSEGNVEVHRIYEDVAPIWVDVDQIEQVLLNLYVNAMQAMPDGGILTVACQRISAEQAIYDTAGTQCLPTQRPSGAFGTAVSAYAWLIDKHASQKELRVQYWLEIIVRDTGIGITNDQLEHIFQPFYTTKAHGIGLGLAITRRLVEDHGGYLRVESQFGYGSTMAVRLPFVTDEEMQSKTDQEEVGQND
jgi:PAS domain S-box-containing protein